MYRNEVKKENKKANDDEKQDSKSESEKFHEAAERVTFVSSACTGRVVEKLLPRLNIGTCLFKEKMLVFLAQPCFVLCLPMLNPCNPDAFPQILIFFFYYVCQASLYLSLKTNISRKCIGYT